MHRLAQRQRLPELMDDPALAAAEHERALRGLSRLNAWSRSAALLWGPVARLAQRLPQQPLRIVDVATGGGDVPVQLWRMARRRGVRVELAGCDVSPRAIAYASQRAQAAGAPIQFFACDAAHGSLPGMFDVVISSLFLHHLAESQVIDVLRAMMQASRRLVLVQDLERSAAGLALAHVAGRLLTRSRVVRHDGPRSVRAGFTREELLDLAQQAGLSGCRVLRQWPKRLLLCWSPLGDAD